jgi:hypothetical protein
MGPMGLGQCFSFALLYRYVAGGMTLLRKILVDNPARLHRFEK